MVFPTTLENEAPSVGCEYSGVTLSQGKTMSVQMRKARGRERWMSLKFWFKPWITKTQEIHSDNK